MFIPIDSPLEIVSIETCKCGVYTISKSQSVRSVHPSLTCNNILHALLPKYIAQTAILLKGILLFIRRLEYLFADPCLQ